VRQGQQNRRGRGRNNNNRKSQNPLSRSFESNGPEMKIRGTPAHIAEKYLTLARDAQSSGDPVLAENYLQHAEHYIRIIMAYREQFNQPGDNMNGNGQRRPEGAEGGEEFGDDDGGEELSPLDEALGQTQPQFQPPPQPTHQHRQGGGGGYDANRHERPFRRDRDNNRFRDRDRYQGDRDNNRDRDRGGDRDRDRGDRQAQGEGRPPQQQAERPQENAAEGGEGRRRERFPQNDQPEFLRRPVRRARIENEEPAGPGKDEPSRD
jgi:hypothetical protein